MSKWKTWCKEKMTKENMIVLALLGILIMVIALPVKKEEKTVTKSVLTDNGSATIDSENIQEASGGEAEMEKRLEELLRCMDGVGEVKVMITFSSTQEQVVEKDLPVSSSQTSENDAAGGSRSIMQQDSGQETVYTTGQDGTKVPYVKKTLSASVEGVTVLAQGGGSAVIQKEITDVIEALFGIAPHKIKVAKMGTFSDENLSR